MHNELGDHNKDSSNMLKTIDLGSNLNVYTKFKKKKYLKKKIFMSEKICLLDFFSKKNFFLMSKSLVCRGFDNVWVILGDQIHFHVME